MAHEGPGSLFAVLQDQGLANSLIAGTTKAYDDFSLFQAGVWGSQDEHLSPFVGHVKCCHTLVDELYHASVDGTPDWTFSLSS